MKGDTRTGFYLHEVQIKEKLLDVFKTGVVTGTSEASNSILLDVWQRVKQIEENCSKVLDENGEPKVFYHHTNAEFTEFLHSKRGKTDAGWLGAGFYFYGIEDEGKGYGKNVMECFLNVREPYYAADDDMFRLSEADSIEESEAFTESLIEDGYDGVYYDGDLRQEMMVFEPDQIKSATDNRGTFDGSNPDITFSVVGEHAANWAEQRAATPFNETLEYPDEALVSFSIQSIMTDWSATLDNFVQNPPAAGSVEYRSDMYVCPTPAVMQMVGARAYDIVLSPDVLVKCLDENIVCGDGKTLKQLYPKEKRRHAITLGTMGQLPASLADPVCIMVSDTQGCVEVVTELKEGADNILVAVQLDAVAYGTRTQRVNRIVSLYGKNGLTELLNRRRLYWNAAKARV
ncbi:MAG: hypothetical protein IKK45_08310 [Akkermansia sp.]|nr:hypothetical protein [Akkermansia sp.]